MTSALSPIIYGGTDATTLKNALTMNSDQVINPSNGSRVDRFWSSQPDPIDSTNVEVFEMSFASTSLINVVSFDCVHFPQIISVEYMDDSSNDWQPFVDPITNLPLQVEILDSYPPAYPDPSTVSGHVHPQHDYDGHWMRNDFQVAAVNALKVRFLLSRNPAGTGPISYTAQPMNYSLALQNIDLGYRIASEDDIPLVGMEPDSATASEVFANTSDVFGSNLGFGKKTYAAANLSSNTDTNAPLLWKSEPQPFPEAVVNFYADLRLPDGSPQIVDQIFIDPLFENCIVNLYYSMDRPRPDFHSRRHFLQGERASYINATVEQGGNIQLGDPGTASALIIDNTYVNWDPAVDWTVAVGLNRLAAGDTNTHVIFDCGTFALSYNQNNFTFSGPGGININLANTTNGNPIATVTLLATMTNGSIRFSVEQNGVTTTSTTTVDPTLFDISLPQKLYYGNNQALTSPLNGEIFAIYLTQAFVNSDDFLDHPMDYSSVPLMPYKDRTRRLCAVLRFDSTWITPTQPHGLLGGPVKAWSQMEWIPIPRSFHTHRGNMKFPATEARYWNLEITNLQPQYYESYVPVTRNIKIFPASIGAQWNANLPISPPATPASIAAASNISSGSYFSDTPTYTGTGASLSGITNTQVYVADDPHTREKLRKLGTPWKYQKLHPEHWAPHFATAGKHVYDRYPYTQTSNVSYFAGFRNIKFSRTNFAVPQNPNVIEENFVDDSNIQGDWTLNGAGYLESGTITGTSNVAYSNPIMTQSPVRGLQFAVQQTDSESIDGINGNFDDPDYDPTNVPNWIRVGDGRNLGLITDNTGSTTLLVSRDENRGFYADIPLNYGPTYLQIENLGDPARVDGKVAHYSDLGAGPFVSFYEGGIQSPTVSLALSGRIHASVRLSSVQALAKPLYVQIIDATSGNVLAEAQSTVGQSGLRQFYCSLDLDDLAASLGVPVTTTKNFAIRIMQKVPSNDSWNIQSVALWSDPVEWEFSCDGGTTWWQANDIKNDPHGVILFPYGLTNYTQIMWRVTSYSPNSAITSIAIRPWYFGQHGYALPLPPETPNGPNTVPSDDYGPIETDARWQGWNLPIPHSWWVGN